MSFLLETKRLRLTELDDGDTAFVEALFTDPDCIRFIGDRGIRDLQTAQDYLQEKLISSYRNHGFGLYKVTLKGAPAAMGICGLVKRDKDNPPDIGFAFLPAYRGGGYCTEACEAILVWARKQRVSDVILAYTSPDNAASIKVLEKIGLHKDRITTLPGQDFESLVMAIQLSA